MFGPESPGVESRSAVRRLSREPRRRASDGL